MTLGAPILMDASMSWSRCVPCEAPHRTTNFLRDFRKFLEILDGYRFPIGAHRTFISARFEFGVVRWLDARQEQLQSAMWTPTPSENPSKQRSEPGRVGSLSGSRSGQMQDVIKGCKNHQHEDDREPYPKAKFLGALRQRSAANRLYGVEQKVTPIEQRYREQV